MTVSGAVLQSISTPERVDSRLGALEYVDGFPSRATSQLVSDHLDFVHALNVFLNGFAGASTVALHKGSSHMEGCYHWIENAAVFSVVATPGRRFAGLVDLGAGLAGRTAVVTQPGHRRTPGDLAGEGSHRALLMLLMISSLMMLSSSRDR